LRPDSDAAGLAQFVVAALEGAILLTKVTKDIAVMEQCVQHLKHHLTLYTTSRLSDGPHAAELVPGRAI
jgi:hypothetical protein